MPNLYHFPLNFLLFFSQNMQSEGRTLVFEGLPVGLLTRVTLALCLYLGSRFWDGSKVCIITWVIPMMWFEWSSQGCSCFKILWWSLLASTSSEAFFYYQPLVKVFHKTFNVFRTAATFISMKNTYRLLCHLTWNVN